MVTTDLAGKAKEEKTTKKTDYHQSPHLSHKKVIVSVVIAQLVAHPFTTLNTADTVRIITQQPKLTHLRGARSVRRRVTT